MTPEAALALAARLRAVAREERWHARLETRLPLIAQARDGARRLERQARELERRAGAR